MLSEKEIQEVIDVIFTLFPKERAERYATIYLSSVYF